MTGSYIKCIFMVVIFNKQKYFSIYYLSYFGQTQIGFEIFKVSE